MQLIRPLSTTAYLAKFSPFAIGKPSKKLTPDKPSAESSTPAETLTSSPCVFCDGLHPVSACEVKASLLEMASSFRLRDKPRKIKKEKKKEKELSDEES